LILSLSYCLMNPCNSIHKTSMIFESINQHVYQNLTVIMVVVA